MLKNFGPKETAKLYEIAEDKVRKLVQMSFSVKKNLKNFTINPGKNINSQLENLIIFENYLKSILNFNTLDNLKV